MFLLLTLACTDYDLVKGDDVTDPLRDSDPGCPENFPDCDEPVSRTSPSTACRTTPTTARSSRPRSGR